MIMSVVFVSNGTVWKHIKYKSKHDDYRRTRYSYLTSASCSCSYRLWPCAPMRCVCWNRMRFCFCTTLLLSNTHTIHIPNERNVHIKRMSNNTVVARRFYVFCGCRCSRQQLKFGKVIRIIYLYDFWPTLGAKDRTYKIEYLWFFLAICDWTFEQTKFWVSKVKTGFCRVIIFF